MPSGGASLAGIGGEIAAHQIIGARHPQLAAETAHQPTGHADMIGMQMGDDHPLDGLARHGPGEELLPGLGRGLVAHAGIDHGPAVAILQQPQIDVVELERQAHAHPMHARRNLDGLAGFGPRLEGIVQILALADPGWVSVTGAFP